MVVPTGMVEVQEREFADREQERLVSAAGRGDADARDRLVADQLGLVRRLARRFANRGEQLDDLVQVGTLALIAAIDRFDGRGGADFRAFAARTVTGSLQNHLRDRGATIRIPRRIHDLTPAVRRHELELSLQLHRRASTAELAEDMGLREEDVRDVLSAADVRVLSIADPRVSDSERLGIDARDVHEAVTERLVVAEALRALTPRERLILKLRFVDELTQAEIARTIGISQVHVSRLIREAMEKLREELLADEAESLVDDAA
jgi:RNA polymerase sigma-B factor